MLLAIIILYTWERESISIYNLQRIFKNLDLFFLKILFIYLRESKSERAQTRGAAEGEGEGDSPLSREPDARLDAGLHPRTLRSGAEPKADA